MQYQIPDRHSPDSKVKLKVADTRSVLLMSLTATRSSVALSMCPSMTNFDISLGYIHGSIMMGLEVNRSSDFVKLIFELSAKYEQRSKFSILICCS